MSHRTLLLAMFVFVLAAAEARAAADDWVAQVTRSRGLVTVVRGERAIDGKAGARLMENDVIVTAPGAAVLVRFNDRSLLAMGPGSEVVLKRYCYDPTVYQGATDALVLRGSVSVTPASPEAADPRGEGSSPVAAEEPGRQDLPGCSLLKLLGANCGS